MKELIRVARISLYIMGLFLILSSCAEEKTYGGDNPNSPIGNNKVDICRIGNDVIRLSVLAPNYSYGDGQLFLSSTTDFSSTPYQDVRENYTWSSLYSEAHYMFPFYLIPEVDKKYYYYVSCDNDKIASGSFTMKDITDILKVKQMTSLSNGMELTLSVPVWFLNIINYTELRVKNERLYFNGSIDKVNHEIKYIVNSYYLESSTEYEFELYFSTEEKSTSSWNRCDFTTTVGTGKFKTSK